MADNKTVISKAEDLEAIFKPEITEGSIDDKLVMPRPGDEGEIVRILYAKSPDGTLGLINVVNNAKFKGGRGEFMSVEKFSNPGVPLQMGLGESLKTSIKRMCNTNGWKIADLPGKVIHITANWYSSSEKGIYCNDCRGSGVLSGVKCKKCDGTGKTIVFNTRARLDLMQATPGIKGKVDEF